MASSVQNHRRTASALRLAITAAAMSATPAFSAPAQEVRVEVVKHADGQPIPGALVVVLPERESPPVGRFSGRDGRVTLTSPRRGGYRVRAEKVGYDSWLSVVLVPSSAPTRVRVGMKPRSLRLPPVTGRGETHCSNLTEQATVAGDMWGEIRKALAANSLTESQALAPLDIASYDRIVDANGTIISDKTEQRRGNAVRPYHLIALTGGAGPSAQATLGVPEAATLLSDEFVTTHCFTGIRGAGPENGLIGLEFKPAKLGNKPDLSGVLWLDPSSYSLRHLAFDYVNIPVSLRATRANGRVDYQQLSGGEWIVSRWQLRVPRGGASGPSGRSAITGYHEIGGNARSAGSPAVVSATGIVSTQSVGGAAAIGSARITGSVLDGTTGRPLAGVEISTFSGSHRTSTNSGGGYELLLDGAAGDSLVFEHPRLRLFRVPRVMPVFVNDAGRAQISVVIPSHAALRQTHCPATGSRLQPSGLALGYVRDEAGNPVADAMVSATWQVLWIEEKGRLISTNERRTTDVRTGADGSYLLCGYTRDAPITFRVATGGILRLEEHVPVPRSMVIERDFRLNSR